MELLSDVGDKKEGGLEWGLTADLNDSARTADLLGQKQTLIRKIICLQGSIPSGMCVGGDGKLEVMCTNSAKVGVGDSV